MSDHDFQQLGQRLRSARVERGLTARKLAEISGASDTTILRTELARHRKLDPNLLQRLADALELPAADLFALAGIPAPTDLPNLTPYLRAKFRDLSQDEISRIESLVSEITAKHGIDPDGPASGQDEQ